MRDRFAEEYQLIGMKHGSVGFLLAVFAAVASVDMAPEAYELLLRRGKNEVRITDSFYV